MTLLVLAALLMLGLVVMGVRDDWLDLFLGWAEQHRYAASISIVTFSYR